jgi:peroxiredoxin/outer membrane lipoprotein-sorting protein
MIKSLLFSTALLLAATAAHTAPQKPLTHPVVTGIPALTHAKTIRVTETSYMTNRNHDLVPDMKAAITLSRPGHYRIAATPLGSDGQPKAKSDLLVTNGTTVTEYVGASNQYLTRTISTNPQFRLSQILILDYHAEFGLLADGFQIQQYPNVRATVTRTQTQLDGHSARLINVNEAADPKTVHMTFPNIRLWLSSRTGLPLRYEEFIVEHGKKDIFIRTDYANWALDKPVAPSTFAWTRPRTATLYPTNDLLAVGTPAPNFSAMTADGKVVHLSDFRGRPVILDFWATWCKPCQAAMPHLESIYQKVKDQNVAVLALCVWDSKSDYLKWVAAKQGTYTFPTAYDPAGEAAANIAQSKFAVPSIPTQYVIDKDGNIAAALPEDDDAIKNHTDHRLENILTKLGVNLPLEVGANIPPAKQ